MNVNQLNSFVYFSLFVFFGLFMFSCEKGKCHSQYFTEMYGYKKGTEVIVFQKHNKNLIEMDNKDTISKLLIRGYVYTGSLVYEVSSSNIDSEFIERVKSIGGYVYCY